MLYKFSIIGLFFTLLPNDSSKFQDSWNVYCWKAECKITQYKYLVDWRKSNVYRQLENVFLQCRDISRQYTDSELFGYKWWGYMIRAGTTGFLNSIFAKCWGEHFWGRRGRKGQCLIPNFASSQSGREHLEKAGGEKHISHSHFECCWLENPMFAIVCISTTGKLFPSLAFLLWPS